MQIETQQGKCTRGKLCCGNDEDDKDGDDVEEVLEARKKDIHQISELKKAIDSCMLLMAIMIKNP